MLEKFMPKFGILAKVLVSFLLLAIAPLVVLGILSLQGISQIGEKAVEDSRESLDLKSADAIQIRSIDLAHSVARFLRERENDINTFTLLPRNSENYLSFSQTRQGEIWKAVVTPGGVREARMMKPLYKEISFVSPTGQEQIKIINDRIVPPEHLYDVSKPINTRYKSEAYFNETINRGRNEIYVSHVTGFYVNKYEMLGDSTSVKDNPAGKRFSGVIRFAKQVYENNELVGIVVLALDHTHLMEFTDHLTPNAPAKDPYVFAVDDTKGNEAYMVDDEGWIISHTRDWMIRGVSPRLENLGEPMQPAVEASHIQDHFLSRPVQLDKVGFMEFLRDIAKIPSIAAEGKPESLWYHWSGHHSFVAFAPIPYYGGDYRVPAGFGWVAITADVKAFHEAANETAAQIRSSQIRIVTLAIIVISCSMVIVLLVAMWLARSITRPVIRLTDLANRISMGDLGLKIDVKSSDEIGALSNSISRLAISLQAAMKRLSRR
ncbi:MAG: hypothetical protein B6244_06585 [Candidatus Cloacimonetes bacterium 4572_55]|nr:MAG: hypothetical protein B6244_06585 [Candidatus Cloacimonetes bacterium 4572_55]